MRTRTKVMLWRIHTAKNRDGIESERVVSREWEHVDEDGYRPWYTRQLSQEEQLPHQTSEELEVHNGRIQYGWFTSREEAVADAIERGENAVEALEERLRCARLILAGRRAF